MCSRVRACIGCARLPLALHISAAVSISRKSPLCGYYAIMFVGRRVHSVAFIGFLHFALSHSTCDQPAQPTGSSNFLRDVFRILEILLIFRFHHGGGGKAIFVWHSIFSTWHVISLWFPAPDSWFRFFVKTLRHRFNTSGKKQRELTEERVQAAWILASGCCVFGSSWLMDEGEITWDYTICILFAMFVEVQASFHSNACCLPCIFADECCMLHDALDRRCLSQWQLLFLLHKNCRSKSRSWKKSLTCTLGTQR